MAQKPAKESQMAALHEKLAEVLLDALNSEECTAASFNVARQFLKDNAIECDPDSPSEAIENLEEHVKQVEEDGLPIFSTRSDH